MKNIDKIIQYIENKGVSVASFERMIGLGNGHLRKIKTRETDVTPKVLDKIRTYSMEMYRQIFGGDNGGTTEEGPEFGNLIETDPMVIIARLTISNEILVKSNEKLVNMITANSGESA